MVLYTLPDLPYDLAALEPNYSARALELHHAKHHQAYVDGANETIEKLAAARDDDDFSALGALEKSLAFHVSGHLLHSVFWPGLSADGGGSPEGELASAIDEMFGSVERLKAQLTSATVGLQGSGWGALHWEPMAERLLVTQVYDHQSNVAHGSLPLLVIDGWEHAFYLDHQTDKAGWLDAFWAMVNWAAVADRFEQARHLVGVGSAGDSNTGRTGTKSRKPS